MTGTTFTVCSFKLQAFWIACDQPFCQKTPEKTGACLTVTHACHDPESVSGKEDHISHGNLIEQFCVHRLAMVRPEGSLQGICRF